jgi:hypothetical protein
LGFDVYSFGAHMPTNGTPDPVNRWATEHYGFQDDASPDAFESRPAPPTGSPLAAAGAPGLGRKAVLAAAGGILGFVVIAGIGGVATADVGGDGARPDGGRDGITARFDGDGRAGGQGVTGGGHR